ncbi:hypothetical protein IEQ34_017880 [Dendrobium chrysotoxum]|uniref:Uncharacterized protein n=1 Tax=Dendrobium chrysotoxum TaxID=161865 RepID=A0AAV7GAV2_DENCH|nr:hypothetical protein IEQ34_017880 [Dendrobium chrysotoxum]
MPPRTRASRSRMSSSGMDSTAGISAAFSTPRLRQRLKYEESCSLCSAALRITLIPAIPSRFRSSAGTAIFAFEDAVTVWEAEELETLEPSTSTRKLAMPLQMLLYTSKISMMTQFIASRMSPTSIPSAYGRICINSSSRSCIFANISRSPSIE